MENKTTLEAGYTNEEPGSNTEFDAGSGERTREKTSIVGAQKITGVLVSYTWRPQGELFALYEVVISLGQTRAAIYISITTSICRVNTLLSGVPEVRLR